jgi:hypothetical protein
VLAGTLVGCLQILGFDEVDQSGPCVSDVDCPATQACGVSGRCESSCSGEGDCPAGSMCSSDPGGRGRCMPAIVHVGDESGASMPEASAIEAAIPEASIPETSIPEAMSTVPEASEGDGSDGAAAIGHGPLDVSEAGDGGACAAACPTFSWCSEDQCLDPQPHGDSSDGTDHAPAMDDQEQAIKIRVNFCGYLTGAGFVVVAANPAISYRMAIYSDDSGSPSMLIGQTAVQSSIRNGANQAPLELADGAAPRFLGCGDTSFALWVAIVWNVNGIEFATEPGQLNTWVTTSESSDTIFKNGFDVAFPNPATPYETPMVQAEAYVIVAGVPNR